MAAHSGLTLARGVAPLYTPPSYLWSAAAPILQFAHVALALLYYMQSKSAATNAPWQCAHDGVPRCPQSIKWAHRALWIDVILYVVFLVVFLLVALGPFVRVAWDGHMMINIFTKFAAQTEWPDPSNTFDDIHSLVDFWSWWGGPFRCAPQLNAVQRSRL